MLSISDVKLREIADILGAEHAVDDDVESGIAALVQDPILARRAIDWLPEAFGMVLVSHMDTVTLPTTFQAKNKRGIWVEINLDAEPIFQSAIRLATQMYHDGPSHIFANIASRSAVLGVVNRALQDGESLKGATLSGPALIGIPAETYVIPTPSIWRKLVRSFLA